MNKVHSFLEQCCAQSSVYQNKVRTLQDIALQIQCAAVKTIFSLRIEPPHTLISFLSLIIFKNTNQGRLVTFFCIWLFWPLSHTDTFDQSYCNSTIHSPPGVHMAGISKEVKVHFNLYDWSAVPQPDFKKDKKTFKNLQKTYGTYTGVFFQLFSNLDV